MSASSPALGMPEEAVSWELMRGQATRGAPRGLQGAALHPGADKAPPLRSFRSGRSQLSLQGAPGAPGCRANAALPAWPLQGSAPITGAQELSACS